MFSYFLRCCESQSMEGHQALEEFCETPQSSSGCSVMLFSFSSSFNLLSNLWIYSTMCWVGSSLISFISGKKQAPSCYHHRLAAHISCTLSQVGQFVGSIGLSVTVLRMAQVFF